MGTINMIKTIKRIYLNTVVIVKIGNFYHVYSKDAYIFSYLFNYKISEKEEVPCCGFPVNSISKIESVLEKNKINYIVVDKRRNYEEDEKCINKQENKYEHIYEISKKIGIVICRIQKINNQLLHNKEDKNINNVLDQIEKVLKDEGRKI